MIREGQLPLGEGFTLDKSRGSVGVIDRPKPVKSSPIESIISPPAKLEITDEAIRKELAKLWFVARNTPVLVPKQEGSHFTRVFLEQDAILWREPQKKNPKRFKHYARIPVLVRSAEYQETVWLTTQGKEVVTFSHETKIPKELIPKLVSLLKQNDEKLKAKRLSQATSHLKED